MRASSWRLDEAKLLLVSCLVAILGIAQVLMVRERTVPAPALSYAVVLSGLLLAGWIGLRWRCSSADQLIYPLSGMLSAIGLVLVFRLEPDLASHQIIWLAIGILLMVAVASSSRILDWLRRYKYTWVVAGMGLVAITLVFGVDPNRSGARLWLGYSEFVFQPSEILKVLLVAFVAGYVEEKGGLIASGHYRFGPLKLPALPYLGPMLAMWGLAIILLLGQKDLGPAFLLFAIFISVLYVASTQLIYVLGGFGVLLLTAFAGYRISSHVSDRVDVWLNPWADPQVTGYQVIQALLAFANGGVAGTGLGQGFPRIIPAVYTDFPLAALGEELGLVGTLAVVVLYLLMTHRGFKIALDTRGVFPQLVAVGLAATISIQALIIIAGNLRLVPLTGITLPFVSYGGSSLVTNFIIVGLLLRISCESSGGR